MRVPLPKVTGASRAPRELAQISASAWVSTAAIDGLACSQIFTSREKTRGDCRDSRNRLMRSNKAERDPGAEAVPPALSEAILRVGQP